MVKGAGHLLRSIRPSALSFHGRWVWLLFGLGFLGVRAAAEEGAIPALKVDLEGPPEAPQEFSRAVLAGVEVVRQARFRYEGIIPLRVSAFWNVRLGEEILVQGEWFRKLEPGQEAVLPLRFQAPAVADRVELLLTLTVQVGETVLASPEARFAVLPAPSRLPKVDRIALFDPRGETAALLEQAGVPFTLLGEAEEAATLKGFRLLVVGSGVLDFANEGFLREVDRREWVAAGGNMLVLEQPPCNLLNLDFIPADFSGLRAVDPMHPAVAGFPLVDWSHLALFRAGSVFFRKPHRGNFRVLLEAGVVGESTPLLEWYVGKGKALLCQLPVTKQPLSVGARWMEALLRAAALAGERSWQQAAYVGGSRGRDLLAQVGADVALLKPGADLKRFEVLLTDGRGLEGRGRWLQAFAQKGGRVCVLGSGPEDLADWAPFPLDWEVRPVGRIHLTEGLRSSPWLRGLPATDLEWEPAQEVPVLAALPPEAATTEPAVFAAVPWGKGHLLFWQVLPGGEETGPVRQKWARLLSILLTNLGVPLPLPGLTFFSNEASLDNRQPSGPWVVPLREWQFRIDPLGLGLEQGWFKPDYEADSWPLLQAGKSWESQGVTRPHPTIVHDDPAEQAQQYDGLAWYRIRCRVPAALSGREVHFQAGGINDYDWLYVNGQEVASTEAAAPGASRDYLLPPTVLRFGEENVLALRIFNSHGPGGLTGNPVQLAAYGATAPSPYLSGP